MIEEWHWEKRMECDQLVISKESLKTFHIHYIKGLINKKVILYTQMGSPILIRIVQQLILWLFNFHRSFVGMLSVHYRKSFFSSQWLKWWDWSCSVYVISFADTCSIKNKNNKIKLQSEIESELFTKPL